LKARLGDVQGARAREVDIAKATGKKDINLYVVAWVIIGGFFALMAILLFIQLPTDSSGVVFMLFGALSSGFGSVVQYFFGSSKGEVEKADYMAASSARKTELLAKTDAIKS
jgi:hypothetical protein